MDLTSLLSSVTSFSHSIGTAGWVAIVVSLGLVIYLLWKVGFFMGFSDFVKSKLFRDRSEAGANRADLKRWFNPEENDKRDWFGKE